MVLEFISEYKWVILFYLIILLTVIINRKKFEIQAKFIALYKTKFGISTTDRAELNGINTMMSKQIRTAADSLK